MTSTAAVTTTDQEKIVEEQLSKPKEENQLKENCYYDGIVTYLPKVTPYSKLIFAKKEVDEESKFTDSALKNRTNTLIPKTERTPKIAHLSDFKKTVEVNLPENETSHSYQKSLKLANLSQKIDVDKLRDPYGLYLGGKDQIAITPTLVTLHKQSKKNENGKNHPFHGLKKRFISPSEIEKDLEEEYMINLLKNSHISSDYYDAFVHEKVGVNAFVNFLIHKRELKTICDQNKTRGLKDSLLTVLLKESYLSKLPPKFLDFFKYRGKTTDFSLKNMQLEDEYLQHVSKVLPLTEIISIDLSGNKMSESMFAEIIESLPSTVRKVDFSGCKVSIKALTQKLKTTGIKIEKLVLKNCDIKTADVKILLSALTDYGKLQQIDLSENSLNDEMTAPFFKFVEDTENYLEEIYLRNNQLGNKFVAKLGRLIANNKKLQVIDFSFNNIGSKIKSFERDEPIQKGIEDFINKSKQNQPTKKPALGIVELINGKNDIEDWLKSLLLMICSNKCIGHLDLSSNPFSLSDCKLIEMALNQNKSILGFHFCGNFGVVNWEGRLLIEDVNKDIVHIQTNRQICSTKPQKSINSFSLKKFHKYKNFCWICDDWRPIKMTFQKSDFSFFPVFAHFEHNNFEPIYIDFSNASTFELKMYVPPEKIAYFFTEGFLFSDFMLPRSMKQEISEDYFLILDPKIDSKINKVDDSQSQPLEGESSNPVATDSLKFLGSPNFQKAFIVNSQSLPVCRYTFSNSNYNFNIDLSNIFSKNFKEEHTLAPSLRSFFKQEEQKIPQVDFFLSRLERPMFIKDKEGLANQWIFNKSIFMTHNILNKEQIQRRFEQDFSNSNFSQIAQKININSEELKKIANNIYQETCEMYAYFCSGKNSDLIFGVSNEQMLELAEQINLIDDADLTPEIFLKEMEVFNQSCDNVVGEASSSRMSRSSFLFFILTICKKKQDLRENGQNQSMSILEIFQQFFVEFMNKVRENAFKREHFWTFKSEQLIIKNEPFLRFLFKNFGDANPVKKSMRMMSWINFKKILEKGRVFSGNFTEVNAKSCFYLSIYEKEMCSEDNFSNMMEFLEFCEALARTSEFCGEDVINHMIGAEVKEKYLKKFKENEEPVEKLVIRFEILILHLYNLFGSESVKRQQAFFGFC